MDLPNTSTLKLSNKSFMAIVEYFNSHCKDTLGFKKTKYSENEDDRLVQFRTAAVVLNTNDINALKGMMVKHTTKMYTIINRAEQGKLPTIEDWMETAGDQVNYIYLLTSMFFMIKEVDENSDWAKIFNNLLKV